MGDWWTTPASGSKAKVQPGDWWQSEPEQAVVAPAPTAPLSVPKTEQAPQRGFLERVGSVFTGPGTALDEAARGTTEYAVPTVSPFQRPGLGSPAPKKGLPSAPMAPVNLANVGAEDVLPETWKRGRGVIQGGESALSGLANFMAVAPLGGLPAQASRLLSAGFSVDMIKGAWDRSPEFRKAWREGDVQGVWRVGTEILGSAAMGVMAGIHAGKGKGAAPVEKAVSAPNEAAPVSAPPATAPLPPVAPARPAAKARATAPKPQPVAGPIEPDWADVTGNIPEKPKVAGQPHEQFPATNDAATLKQEADLLQAAQDAGVNYITGEPMNAIVRKAQGYSIKDRLKRASEAESATTPAEAAAEAIKIPPPPKFGNSLEGRAAKQKFEAKERADAIKAKAKAQQDATKAKEKAAADALKQKAKEQKETERAQKEAAKAQIEQAKQQQEARTAELAAKIQKMPPAEVEQGIAEAVKALPDEQLREVATAQELPKPPKEGEPEAPLPPLAEAVADELRARQAAPPAPPVAPNATGEFPTGRKPVSAQRPIEVREDVQGLNDRALGQERYYDQTPEQRKAALPTIVRSASDAGVSAQEKAFAQGWLDAQRAAKEQPAPRPSPPALGSEPVAPGGVAAPGDVAGGGAKQPWEMTPDEFFAEHTRGSLPERTRSDKGWIVEDARYDAPGGARWWDHPPRTSSPSKLATIGEYYDRVHKSVVRAALREGKPVPPEVLADYPDLAPSPGPATAAEVSPVNKPAAGGEVAPPAGPERGITAASARNAKAVAERKGKLKGERGSFTAPITPEDIKGVGEKAKRAGSELGKHAIHVWHEAQPLGNVLRREGDIGKGLMKTYEAARDRGEVKAGIRIADIKEAGLDRLTREEQFNLHDALTGRADPMNVKVAEVFDAARATLEGTGAEMERRGITAQEKITVKPGDPPPEGYKLNSRQKLSMIAAERAGRSVTLNLERPAKSRKNYYPQQMASVEALKSGHVRKDMAENIQRLGLQPDKPAAEAFIDRWATFLESGKRDDVLMQHLIDTKQVDTAPEALKALMGMRDRTIGRQKMGSMEYARQVDLPFYDPIPGRVLPAWLLKSSVFLERSGALGQKNEVVTKAVYDIKKAGGNYAEVADAAKRILGAVREPDTGINKSLRAIRTFQGFKLALSAIPNATQPINILLKSDLSSFLSGIKGSMTKEGRKFGERSGAVLENVIQESLKNAGAEGEALGKFLKWNAFIPVEKNNRILAANAGRAYAQRLTNKLKLDPQNKGVRYRMEELGLRPDDILGRGGLSLGDTLMAAKKMSDITQFRARAEDLPALASTPWGKVIFQFKNFSYNQGRLVFDATVGEMKRGEYGAATKNLLILATVFPLAGEAISDLRNALTGRENKKEGWDRYWGTITQSAALGLVGDLMQSGSWGKGASALAGPTGSDVADVIDLAGKKNVGREAAKLAFRRIPMLGPIFVNRNPFGWFPKKKPSTRFKALGGGF